MADNDNPYTMEKSRGFMILSLQPKLNEVQWGDVQQIGNEIIPDLQSNRSPALLVDLSNLDYMGSSMVALLVRLWKSVQEKDGQMVVQSEQKMVTEVLSIAGLNALWEVVATREEALRAIKHAPASSSVGGSWIGPGIAILTAAGAGWIWYATKSNNPPLGNAQQSLYAVYGLAAVAVIVGGIALARNAGIPRLLGGIALLAGLGVGGAAFMQKPAAQAPEAEKAQKPAAAAPQKNVESDAPKSP